MQDNVGAEEAKAQAKLSPNQQLAAQAISRKKDAQLAAQQARAQAQQLQHQQQQAQYKAKLQQQQQQKQQQQQQQAQG